MVTTMVEMYVTTATNQTSTTSHQLPVIIAGSLTGACILLIILAYLLYHCFRAQRETRAKYCKYRSSALWACRKVIYPLYHAPVLLSLEKALLYFASVLRM